MGQRDCKTLIHMVPSSWCEQMWDFEDMIFFHTELQPLELDAAPPFALKPSRLEWQNLKIRSLTIEKGKLAFIHYFKYATVDQKFAKFG